MIADTFAGKARAAAQKLPKEEFGLDEWAEMAGLDSIKDRPRLISVAKDFIRSGEMKRVSRGRYIYTGKSVSVPMQKQEVMWRYLRSSRSFGGVTVEELREAAEVSEECADGWLGNLARNGAVKEVAGKFKLIAPIHDMPRNEEKGSTMLSDQQEKAIQTVKHAIKALSDAALHAVKAFESLDKLKALPKGKE